MSKSEDPSALSGADPYTVDRHFGDMGPVDALAPMPRT